MIINEIKEVLAIGNEKEYKKFGITMAIVFVLIFSYLYWKEYSSAIYFIIIAAIFALSAFLLPKILKYFYNVWMGFAAIMGYFMSRIILSLIFFILFAPVGIVTRLLKKDLLKEKWDNESDSYWILRDNKPYDPKSAENQY